MVRVIGDTSCVVRSGVSVMLLLCPESDATTTRSATMFACAAVAPFTRRIHHCARADQKGTSVRRRFHCRYCVVEMERLALADGTAVLVCVDCDLIGLEREIADGGPLWPAGLAERAREANKRRPRLLTRRGGGGRGE
jgi:hypothetical protein